MAEMGQTRTQQAHPCPFPCRRRCRPCRCESSCGWPRRPERHLRQCLRKRRIRDLGNLCRGPWHLTDVDDECRTTETRRRQSGDWISEGRRRLRLLDIPLACRVCEGKRAWSGLMVTSWPLMASLDDDGVAWPCRTSAWLGCKSSSPLTMLAAGRESRLSLSIKEVRLCLQAERCDGGIVCWTRD